jgi:hypothetical protein
LFLIAARRGEEDEEEEEEEEEQQDLPVETFLSSSLSFLCVSVFFSLLCVGSAVLNRARGKSQSTGVEEEQSSAMGG